MKAKLSIILSIISLVGVLSVWSLWTFGSMKVAVVSLDTFIGVIVALLAIVFTIIVGLQIVNAIDMREKMMQLQQRQDLILENERRMLENEKNYVKLVHNLQAGICDSNADLQEVKGQFVEAFMNRHTALHHAILAEQPDLKNKIIQLQLINQSIIVPPLVGFPLIKKQIEDTTQFIRNTEAYKLYLSVEYEQTMLIFWQKMKMLGFIE